MQRPTKLDKQIRRSHRGIVKVCFNILLEKLSRRQGYYCSSHNGILQSIEDNSMENAQGSVLDDKFKISKNFQKPK